VFQTKLHFFALMRVVIGKEPALNVIDVLIIFEGSWIGTNSQPLVGFLVAGGGLLCACGATSAVLPAEQGLQAKVIRPFMGKFLA
jgi:hypothetical protein